MAAEISGRVVWVAPTLQSGGRVRRDQLLFRIDDADYLARVEQARANVAVQQVELLRVTEEARIARTQYERFRRLRERPGSAADTSPLVLWEPQMEAAEAVLARDRAVLRRPRRLVANQVHAPFARWCWKSPWTWVSSCGRQSVGACMPPTRGSGGPALGRRRGAHPRLCTGSRATRTGACRPGGAEYGEERYAWTGFVDRAEAALDEQTRTIDVIVRVPDPFTRNDGPPLLVGKFVEVEIDGLAPEEYFRVRRPALRPGNEVWVVDNDTVRIVPVHVLQRSDNEVFLTGALEADQAVIIGGIQLATEGMPVRTDAGGAP